MSRKLSNRKPVRKPVSSLLGALMATDSEPNPILLKPYVALDALFRGHGSTGVLTMLGQHLMVAEQLCLSGFAREQLAAVRQGHAALVRIDGRAKEGGTWVAQGQDYEALRDAMHVYERQLRIAPHDEVRIAQAVMVSLLGARKNPASAVQKAA